MTEMEEKLSNEELLGPPKIDIVSVGLITLWSTIAGFVGGLFILVCTYLFLGTSEITTTGVFPYILSLVGFFAILITGYLTLLMNRLVFPDKYKQGLAVFTQMSIFSIILYILITPLYIYVGSTRADFLIFVFVVHILINTLGSSLLSEVLSNYRYVLLSIYGSFIGFFVAVFLSIIFFMNYSPSNAALYSLVGVIILVNLVITALRTLFEYVYYKLYLFTGLDQLGDIFAKIENEERAIVEKAQKELEKF